MEQKIPVGLLVWERPRAGDKSPLFSPPLAEFAKQARSRPTRPRFITLDSTCCPLEAISDAMAEGFVLYVADSPHVGRESAGRARRLAVWGTLLLVIVAVSAMTARKSGSPVALKAGDKFVEEEHFEEKFLAKAASEGHPDRRNAKLKLVPAQRPSQARWQNVGARPENNIFNSRSGSSSSDGPGGDAGAAADAMSAVAKVFFHSGCIDYL